jgi:GT2 family glycosyltransferase
MISGACMLVRREALRAIGGWDEGYFLHFEDMDLCLRLRAAGWGVWVAPQAKCVHEKGRCSGRLERGWAGWRRRGRVAWHKHRAAMRFLRRHWFAGWRWVLWPAVALGVWGHAVLEVVRPAR